MDSTQMTRAVRRLAHQLVEDIAADEMVLVGVRTRGVPLANRLKAIIDDIEGTNISVGELDITLYRDDVFSGSAVPEVRPTHLPFDMVNKAVVLVDDVLYTGRTTRAALDAIVDWGRPKCIKLAVLVDRGHRELPIQADFIGLSLETQNDESVQVMLDEIDNSDRVVLWGISGEDENAT